MKRILLSIAVLSFVVSTMAQKYGGGLEIGTTYSWLATDSKHASAEDGKIGFTYGAFLDINMTDNFTFTTGINMNYLGGSIKYNDPITLKWDGDKHSVSKDAEVMYKVQYLEFPVSIKGKTKEIGYITYFARLGANPSLSIKTRADVDGTVVGVDDPTDLNIKDNINLFNIGWHVGGGIEYSLGGSTSVIAELLFSQNFISITKDNITEKTGNNMSVTNSLIGLKVGIKF